MNSLSLKVRLSIILVRGPRVLIISMSELFPWADLGRPKPADGEEDKKRKRKEKGNANESQGEKKDGTTTLDRFMSKAAADTQETEAFGGDTEPADQDFVMNEDGTMLMVPSEPS